MGGTSKRMRVLLIRDAAIGDGVMITPAIRDFAERGCEVHVACKKYVGYAVYAYNPHIHKLHRFERAKDMDERERNIHALVDKVKPDVWVDLAGSCEGQFLYHSIKPMYAAPIELRRACADGHNYYEHINQRVLGCQRVKPEMYAGAQEDAFWTKLRSHTLGAKYVQCQLGGSSFNKIYPYWPVVIRDIQRLDPRIVVITTGGIEYSLIEAGAVECGADPARMWPTCGNKRYTLRDSLIMTKYVDCVVGPETGVLNAAACWDTPKVIMLSHSNYENLCKHWTATYPLQSPAECSPCYRIICVGDPCFYVQDGPVAGAMACMEAIDPRWVVNTVREALCL